VVAQQPLLFAAIQTWTLAGRPYYRPNTHPSSLQQHVLFTPAGRCCLLMQHITVLAPWSAWTDRISTAAEMHDAVSCLEARQWEVGWWVSRTHCSVSVECLGQLLHGPPLPLGALIFASVPWLLTDATLRYYHHLLTISYTLILSAAAADWSGICVS